MSEPQQKPDWNELERWLLERCSDTLDARYQDAATLLYQSRKMLIELRRQVEMLRPTGRD